MAHEYYQMQFVFSATCTYYNVVGWAYLTVLVETIDFNGFVNFI